MEIIISKNNLFEISSLLLYNEIKGSIIVPSYKKLIITSNYSIEELLQSLYIVDEELMKAIKRRVKELYFKNKEDKELIKEQILKQIE